MTAAAGAGRRRRDGRFVAGSGLLLIVAVLALLGPAIAGTAPVDLVDVALRRFVAPLHRTPDGAMHILGTDRLARDILLRLFVGARVSLAVGGLAGLVSALVGISAGAVAGYAGRVVDRAISAVTDAVLAVPRVPLLLLLVALFEPGIAITILAIGLTGWMSIARLVRAEVLALKRREFVETARALGASPPRVLVRHVLPHATGPALVATALGVGNAIMLEAGLSFLGLGVQPPTPSWGNMIAAGRDALVVAPWVALAPAALVALVTIAASLVADALESRLAGRPRRARTGRSPACRRGRPSARAPRGGKVSAE